ncbi:hypothetical protein SAY86_017915 [Trapa natans]|uniref:Uncharacterized protein n=1 Tax=Trapa natans TaxID=22666 RepID=A0AAN7M5Y9_TRANT|nr:hypothetical protein SAY86_017915 [Trapa natans]
MAASEILLQVMDCSMLNKVAVFLVVQALVYLILVSSSDIFSRTRPSCRSDSFKPASSSSIMQMLAAVSDVSLPVSEPYPASWSPFAEDL